MFLSLDAASVNIELRGFTRKLRLCLICPKGILPEACQYAFWQISVWFLRFAFSSGVLFGRLPLSPLWLRDRWCHLTLMSVTLEFTSDLFGSCSGLFGVVHTMILNSTTFKLEDLLVTGWKTPVTLITGLTLVYRLPVVSLFTVFARSTIIFAQWMWKLCTSTGPCWGRHVLARPLPVVARLLLVENQ